MRITWVMVMVIGILIFPLVCASPIVTEPSPSNNAMIDENHIELKVYVDDDDTSVSTLQVLFYNADGDVLLGNETVINGGRASITWRNLTNKADYSWYVNVSNGSAYYISPTWTFRVDVNEITYSNLFPYFTLFLILSIVFFVMFWHFGSNEYASPMVITFGMLSFIMWLVTGAIHLLSGYLPVLAWLFIGIGFIVLIFNILFIFAVYNENMIDMSM